MNGFGLGLRAQHIDYILSNNPPVDWFEILSENYFARGGKTLYLLDQIVELYPVVMHGVSLNIGSVDPINFEYLDKLKKLKKRVKAQWISDHFCWTGVNNLNSHDLLPLPHTDEVIKHVVNRLKIVQDYLGCEILLENPSTYMKFTESTYTEYECLSIISREADCYILLDINNIYVSASNLNFSPEEYLLNMPKNKIKQIHLAGHSKDEDIIIDTHDSSVQNSVWDLYAFAIEHFGFIPTMIERDDKIPEFTELLLELQMARDICQNVKERSHA